MYTAKQTYSENEIKLNYGVETNHLGNVLATISARTRLIFDNSNPPVYQYREADVLSVSDYEPGGFPTPGRQFNSESYRFGHNTQEKVDEWNGTTGTHYTALYWEYDSRLIWRQTPDPKGSASVSPYACFGGNPILYSDVLGDIWDVGTDDQTKSDVKGLAKNKNNAKLINIDDNGRVSLDFGKRSPKRIDKLLANDEGLKLVSDLVNAKDDKGKDLNFFYSTSAPFDFCGYKENDDAAPTDFSAHKIGENAIDKNGEASIFSYNASLTTYGTDSKGITRNTLLPKAGYNGQVAIAPGKPTLYLGYGPYKYIEGNALIQNTGPMFKTSRSDIVKHELRENLIRSQSGMNYNAAHEATEKMYFGFDVTKFIWGK